MIPDMAVSPGSDTSFFLATWVKTNFREYTYGATFSVFHQYATNTIYEGSTIVGYSQIRDFEHRLATAFLKLILLNQWPPSINNSNPISLSEVSTILTQFESF
jgi:hypothetical protein